MATSTEKMKLHVSVRDQATKKLQGIAGSILGIGSAYIAITKAVDAFSVVIDKATQSEKVWNEVTASLERHNLAIGRNIESVVQYAETMQSLTGISDEVIGTSIQLLLDYNNDIATSYELVRVAADLAAGGHMDMKAAVDLVGKASVGYTGMLSRYGIIIDQNIPSSERFAEAIKQINERFGGAAQAQMDAYAGKQSLYTQRLDDMYENIGKKILPILSELTGAAIELMDAIDKTTKVISDQIIETDKWSVSLGKVSGALIAVQLSWTEKLLESMKDALTPIATIGKGLQNLSVGLYAIATGAKTGQEIWDEYWKSFEKGFGDAYKKLDDTEPPKLIDPVEAERLTGETSNIYGKHYGELIELEDEYDIEMQYIRDNRFLYVLDNLDNTLQAYEEHNRAKEIMEAELMMHLKGYTDIMAKGIVDVLTGAEKDMKKIFSRMAEHFIKFFVDKGLNALANIFLPGLLGILGSIFDTPANDRMAMQQGEHFAHYFMHGAERKFADSNFGNTITAAISRNFINREIIPAIEEESIDGGTRLMLDDNNITGKPYTTYG